MEAKTETAKITTHIDRYSDEALRAHYATYLLAYAIISDDGVRFCAADDEPTLAAQAMGVTHAFSPTSYPRTIAEFVDLLRWHLAALDFPRQPKEDPTTYSARFRAEREAERKMVRNQSGGK